MIDLHTHTFLSDGVLSPAELVTRAQEKGYAAIGLTDHVDASNMSSVLSQLHTFVHDTQPYLKITVIAGIELTHVPPGQISPMVDRARDLGCQLVVLHGETISEPVAPGTNEAGIKAGIDILAHPGIITETEVRLAADRGVCLEITSRPSHSYANGLVAGLAKRCGAALVLNSDSHAPGDLLSASFKHNVVLSAGLGQSDIEEIDRNMTALIGKPNTTVA